MRALYALLVSLVFATTALAQERITSFDTDITVERSGDIVITETIDLISEGQAIQRGIFRELPARYSFMGVTQDYDYELLSITRDGERDDVSVSRNGNALVWRIGNANRRLAPGPHRYVIRYRVEDAIRRHDDKDELYWNATGSYWQFPIEEARATYRFPDGATVLEAAAYTGRVGSEAQDARINARSDGVTAVTTRPLRAREGLTLAVSIDTGVIAPMSDARKAELRWIRIGAPIMLALGGLGLLGYYLLQWMRVGRDPQKPPVFARYEPPKGYSPAAAHYIYHRGHKGMTALSAQLLQMGAKDAVFIIADEDETKITLQSAVGLDADGKLLVDALFPTGYHSVVMDGEPDSRLHKGARSFLSQIARRYGRDYFRRNLGLAMLGIIASAVLIFIVFNARVSLSGPLIVGLIGAIAAMNLLFLYLLPAPTPKGSKVHAEIEGFRLYLKTAEEDRINTGGPNQKQPPMMSVELYERFLPYAVALDVEKPWTKHFETTLPREAAEYRPSYARGSQIFGRGRAPIDIGRTVAKAMTAGVAAAAPVSQSSGSSGGWSSGSGGGGFSGGGGGGGGGGGW